MDGKTSRLILRQPFFLLLTAEPETTQQQKEVQVKEPIIKFEDFSFQYDAQAEPHAETYQS